MKNSALAGAVLFGLLAVACSKAASEEQVAADGTALSRDLGCEKKIGDDDDDDSRERVEEPRVMASAECAPVLAKCEGGQPNVVRTTDPQVEGIEVHEISVSDPPNQAGKRRHVEISVDRAGRHLLVIRSYESADFEIIVGKKATLAAVLIDGYHAQTISGVPAGVPVENHSGDLTFHGLCSYEWPKANGHCNAPVLPGEGGLPRFAGTTSFTGCYGPLSL